MVRPREHNQILLPIVHELLQNFRLGFADLDAIAFGVGPGSFTGLRLSAGVVQGLAFAANKPVIPVSSLATLAFSVGEHLSGQASQNILIALDARMQDVYFGAYRYEQGSLTTLAEDTLLPLSQLKQHIENYSNPIMIGDGWPLMPDSPAATKSEPTHYPHAKAVLALAQKYFAEGKTVSAELALPIYLRETVSWQKWQPKSGSKTILPSI